MPETEGTIVNAEEPVLEVPEETSPSPSEVALPAPTSEEVSAQVSAPAPAPATPTAEPVSEPIAPSVVVSVVSAKPDRQSFFQKFLATLSFRKQKRFAKILAAAGKGPIANDEVEKLLHVSDKSAERYLAELVRQGRLRRIEPAEKARYELVR